MERMIHYLTEEISFSQILMTFIYGAIDDLYQKITHFSKSKLCFLHTFY